MGKASSNKKVARAAKAGGSRARAAGERNLLFPVALAAVVILGTLLVVYARDDRQAQAEAAPTLTDHWHSAYGIYVCGEFLPDLPEFEAPQNAGTHTHGDGLVHIHPFSTSRTGDNATLEHWFDDAGTVLGNEGGMKDGSLAVPGGKTYREGVDTCDDLDGDPIVQVAVWQDVTDAIAEKDPDRVVTGDFGSIHFDQNGEAYTIAFMPEGAELPPPPSAEAVSAAQGVPDTSPTSGATPDSSTTVPDESSSTTTAAPADESSTTEADAGQ